MSSEINHFKLIKNENLELNLIANSSNSNIVFDLSKDINENKSSNEYVKNIKENRINKIQDLNVSFDYQKRDKKLAVNYTKNLEENIKNLNNINHCFKKEADLKIKIIHLVKLKVSYLLSNTAKKKWIKFPFFFIFPKK